MKEDIVEKFWREYIEADILGRDDKIKHIVTSFIVAIDALKDNPKIREHAVTTQLRSYFDDLIDYMYVENLKKKKKHTK